MKTIIEARDLKKHFRSIKALDGITVEILEGVTLILGPNGGGKSTFLKLATGVYRPTSGEILVFGETVEQQECQGAFQRCL